MINKRNEVFTRVKDYVLSSYPQCNISSEYVNVPKTMPHISIEMSDSYTPNEYQTNSIDEVITAMTFTVNVYSNKASGKMQECYEIMEKIDVAFRSMNFRRTSLLSIPNLENASLGRLTARYEGMADKSGFYRI